MPQMLTHLGKYRIEQELGRGAMGVVYKAFDPVVERMVAIKTIRVEMDEEGQLVGRLQREAKSVGRLEHPNIVTLYDAGETAGLFYLVMQFIEGETLQDRLSVERYFDLAEVQDVFGQICAGLDYAHQRAVIHRDIKPANIMITRDGVVKLTDFGIAKVAGTGVTSTGLVVGTPSYMSPEQALGRPLDGRSDIFSLGSILYEMITGEMAFPGQNVTTVMYKIVHETPTPVAALQPGLDPGIEAVISKALAKNPDQRFQTCAEFAAGVQNYINQSGSALRATIPAYTPPLAPPSPMASRTPSVAIPPPPVRLPPSPSRAPSTQVPAPAASSAQPIAQPSQPVTPYPGTTPSAPETAPGSGPAWAPVPGSGSQPAIATQPVPARSGAHFAWLGGGVLGTLLLVVIILLVVQMRAPAPGPAPATQPSANSAPPAANVPQPAASDPKASQPTGGAPAAKTPETRTEAPKAASPLAAGGRTARGGVARPETIRREAPGATAPATQVTPPPGPAARPAVETGAQTAPAANPALRPSAPPQAPAATVPDPEPENYQAAMLKGDLAFQGGEYQKALAAYLKAYRMNPNSRAVKRKLRTVLTLLNRPEDAQKYK
ncbi:MAG: protein kinase [Terriglobia bacterium]